ncbi:MAG: hypothetical protein QOG83_3530, partial [Alphaproteobacteria bacterium]|nr:hypothetical protein [Alphaproteobacteria bacterium]
RQLDLPRSWLNESVTMYTRRLEQDGDRILVGVYPSPERVGLRVVAAKPSYLPAMKLRFFPEQELPGPSELRLRELAEAIQSKSVA